MTRSPLHAVQTQRESVRDRERAALGKLLTEESQLVDRLQQLDEERNRQLAEVAELAREGKVDVRAAASRRYYAGQLRAEVIGLMAAHEELQNEIDAQRRMLADADAAVKAVEKLLEKRAEEERIENERRSQLQIEDQWAASRAAG